MMMMMAMMMMMMMKTMMMMIKIFKQGAQLTIRCSSVQYGQHR